MADILSEIMNNDSFRLPFAKREKYRFEIRKNKIDISLNKKRALIMEIDLNGETIENKDLPSVEDKPEEFFSYICRKIQNFNQGCIENKSIENILKYVTTLKKYSCVKTKKNYKITIAKSGVINHLLIYLTKQFSQFQKLQNEILVVIAHLFIEEHSNLLNYINSEKMIENILSLIDVSNKENIWQILITLCNLASGSEYFSCSFVKNKVVDKILFFMNSGIELDELRNILYLFDILSQKEYADIPNYYNEIFKIANILKSCLKVEDEEIICCVLGILAFLTDTDDSNLKKLMEIFDKASLKVIMELTLHQDGSIKSTAIRVICNILAGENIYIKQFVDLGVLNKFSLLLDSKNETIRKEIYWGVSNILAADLDIIKTTLDHDIHQKLLKNFNYEAYKNKREIIFCWTNALIGSDPETTNKILNFDIISLFNEMVEFSEVFILKTILEATEKILINFQMSFENPELISFRNKVKEANFVNLLDEISRNPNQNISEFATYLLEKYFDQSENY